MNGCVIDSSENMEGEIEKAGLTYPVVVKAQVQIGGRGKAGGIRFADTPQEATNTLPLTTGLVKWPLYKVFTLF